MFMRIIFPEFENPIIKQALAEYKKLCDTSSASRLNPSEPLQPIEALPAPNLETACEMIVAGEADSMIAGIDYSSRDVILACRDHFGMGSIPSELVTPLQVKPISTPDNSASSPAYSTFSGLTVMQKTDSEKGDQLYLLADMAACKHPTEDQLLEIITQTIESAAKILPEPPRIALLSFSTAGSGGHDDTITLFQNILTKFQNLPLTKSLNFAIDGEMQLDAAINPTIAAKKFPNSPVAGQANVLIAPDLNSGNILYKSFEQLAGFTVAGPILQGFNFPVSDLSRGSTVTDVLLTIETMTHLVK